MDSQLKKGLLEGCVLASLKKGDSYGYKIITDVSQYIEISESTLYPILRRLEKLGCLNAYNVKQSGRTRKYYSITPTGRASLREFMRDMQELVDIYRYICD